ncbi:MAG: glycosyltransferase family A protein [Rhodospirillaceae bacterium]|nr:glycosyltransferase family A protein [Rhodospirillaceae bacterium]
MSLPSRPLVRVLIPTYERLALFNLCLESVLKNTYENFEIWVFDNSATRNIETLIARKADPRITYHRNQSNIGASGNYRKCFANAGGDYFIVLTSDILFHPTMIAEHVALAESDPSIAIVFSLAYNLQLSVELTDSVMPQGPIKGTRSIGPSSWIQQGFMSDQAVVLPLRPMMEAYFYRGVHPSCTGFESLIRTEYYKALPQQEFQYGSNGEEYRHGIGLLMFGDKVGYLGNRLKDAIVHGNRMAKPNRAYIEFEKVRVIEELAETHLRFLAMQGYDLRQIHSHLHDAYTRLTAQNNEFSATARTLSLKYAPH